MPPWKLNWLIALHCFGWVSGNQLPLLATWKRERKPNSPFIDEWMGCRKRESKAWMEWTLPCNIVRVLYLLCSNNESARGTNGYHRFMLFSCMFPFPYMHKERTFQRFFLCNFCHLSHLTELSFNLEKGTFVVLTEEDPNFRNLHLWKIFTPQFCKSSLGKVMNK